MTDFRQAPRAVFPLGMVVATIGADELDKAHLLNCLTRHARGDWGDLEQADRDENAAALKTGGRILSAYRPCAACPENTLWIITEADRSVTTLLLSARAVSISGALAPRFSGSEPGRERPLAEGVTPETEGGTRSGTGPRARDELGRQPLCGPDRHLMAETRSSGIP